MTTIVYKFGLRPPTSNAAIVRDQMRLAHRYYNDLVQIERGRRAAERSLLAPYADIREREDEARRLDAVCEELSHEIKAGRKSARKRTETQAQRDALNAARVAKRDAQIALAERRRAMRDDPAIIVGSAEIDARRLELSHSARAHCGVYWGTYQLAEDAAGKAAADTPMYAGSEPSDPRFARWTGEGAVSVQLMGGLSVSELYEQDTQVRIDPVDVDKLQWAERRGDRRRAGFTTLHLRVGSDEKRRPVFASFPMLQHRAIDPAARIKRVTVSVRRRGATERHGAVEEWSCELTAQLPDGARLPRATSEGVVAVDVGWRVIGDELRVAAWASSDGRSGELRLPRTREALGALAKCEEIESGRDKDLDREKTLLAHWMASRDVPEWLRTATSALAQWRSQGRFASLAKAWRERRFDGDEEAFTRIESWRLHDQHLWRWTKDATGAALRRRREVYRVFAANLSRSFSTLLLERFDLRKVAERPSLEEDAARQNETARANRQRASISELRGALANAFAARGGPVHVVSAVDETRTCRECGLVVDFATADDTMHACECGAVWDQDLNACHVRLASFADRERSGDAQKAGTARKEHRPNESETVNESRWARARRKRAEKEARVDAARKALAGAAE